jgi:zinc protease
MNFNRPFIGALIAGALLFDAAAARAARSGEEIEIPYTRFVLTNGLTLIVHEDPKAAIVAVNIWYHVGSKNEPPGKTGFAHLFEHLMFNGSEHFNDDYFKAMEMVGATDLNGTTSEDRTDYFQNAPKDALDFLLWMESDRMGHLLGAIDQAKLDEQRGVVQNEKRQRENQPYGIAEELIVKGTYPPSHPYGHTVIGSMDDLDAASLEDVREWFQTYYGAANATLVVAGDVDTETVRRKVEQHFGAIPPGPPVARHQQWIAKRTGVQRQVAQDRVPLGRLYKIWNIPAFGERETDQLDLISDVLGTGKTSRLYKRLVYDDQIATDATAYVDVNEVSSRFVIVATARPGVPLAKVEAAIDEELARYLSEGPTAEEMERVKTEYVARFLRSIERIGGFGGKSSLLAQYQVFKGSPDYYKATLQHVRDATARDLQETAKAWLSDGVYILEIHPFPAYAAAGTDVDRSRLPVPSIAPEVKFPDLQQATLSNGMKIILAERRAVPLVNFVLQVDGGYAADQFAAPGTAKLAMNMLAEGTKSRSSLQISEELARLGATLNTASDLDTSSVILSAMTARLDRTLDIFADVILNPTFPEADFNRLKNQQLDSIQREKTEPGSMALRVLPELLYGERHAYSIPFTGSGDIPSVSGMTAADVRKFYETWFKPNNATMIIVGDATMSELRPKLEQLFGNWRPGTVPEKNIGQVAMREQPSLYLMDRPGSIQSMIFAGELAPPKNNPQEIAIEVMNHILGGTFTSRINMNLREDKHWSYGARSMLVPARGQRPFLVIAPVQTDKTKEAIIEVQKELSGVTGDKPITPEELAKTQKDRTLKLTGSWETSSQVGNAIAELVRFRLPEDYYETYPDKVRALELSSVTQAASMIINPRRQVWVVVGDRSRIEPGLRELGFSRIRLIDTDGNVLD